ncbi:uncharacterized protein NESG_01565 [Nematocida ausubeli]|uniref:Uncharacterized protein n=1 Tax=Nematocida ausubeli (strain ATCC PRA-371 / ERTm2) TaxID=1913371 RepID=A0A086J0B9_NEMA1|nr:uncharacterized protein NESG_01565 [Nematocida ausubeli]KFG25587.1 hypothetical protein NESG_01565 [Nematocida ausubeli]
MIWFAQTRILKISIVVVLVGIVSLLAALAYINQGALCNIVKNNMDERILMTVHTNGNEPSSSKDPVLELEYSSASDSSSYGKQSKGSEKDFKDMATDSEGSVGYSEGSVRDSEDIQTDSEDVRTDSEGSVRDSENIQTNSEGSEKRAKTPPVQPGSSKEEIGTPLVTMRSNARAINALRTNLAKPSCNKNIPPTDESTDKDQNLEHPLPIPQKFIKKQLNSMSEFNLQEFNMDVVLLKNKEAELSDIQKELDKAFSKYSEDKSIIDDVIKYTKKAGSIADIGDWVEKKMYKIHEKILKGSNEINTIRYLANQCLLRHDEQKKLLDMLKPKEETESEKICSSQENIVYDLKTEKLEFYDEIIQMVDAYMELNNKKIEYASLVIQRESILYELALEKSKKLSEKMEKTHRTWLVEKFKSNYLAAMTFHVKRILKKHQDIIKDMEEFRIYADSILNRQGLYKKEVNEIRSIIFQMQKLQEIESKRDFKWDPVYVKYTQENTKAITAYRNDVDIPIMLRNSDSKYEKVKNDIASVRGQYDKCADALAKGMKKDYVMIQGFKQIVEEKWAIYSNKKEKLLKLSWCVKKLKDNNIKMHDITRKLHELIEKNKLEHSNYIKEHKAAVDGIYNHWMEQELSYRREEKNCNNPATSNKFLIISSKIDNICKARNNIEIDHMNMIKNNKITVDILYKDHPSYKDYLNYIKAIATYDKNIAELDLSYMDSLKSKTNIAILIKEKDAARAIDNSGLYSSNEYTIKAYENHIRYIETCMDYIKERCDYLKTYIARLNNMLVDDDPPLFLYMYTEATTKKEVDKEEDMLHMLIKELKDRLEGKR